MRSEIITKEAYKAFKKGSYVVVIQLLEKNIAVSNNPYDYFLLVLSYLLTDKLMLAEAILRKAIRQYPNYVPLLEIQAFLLLKAARTKDEACTGYADILKLSPGNRKIVKIVTRIQNTTDLEVFQKDAKLKDYIRIIKPPTVKKFVHNTKRRYSYGAIVVLSVCVVMCIIIGMFFFTSPLANLIQEKIELLFAPKKTIHNIEALANISLDGMHYEIVDKIQKNRTPEFYTSNDECIKDFNRAKWLIKEGKENEAMMLLNKIDASNANIRVKDRVSFLKDFIVNMKERSVAAIHISDVLKKPYLYKGINVKWQGKVANYKQKGTAQIFQLLVNYDNNKFDGLVEVFAPAINDNIENGAIVTVEGVITNIVGQKSIIIQALKVDITKP